MHDDWNWWNEVIYVKCIYRYKELLYNTGSALRTENLNINVTCCNIFEYFGLFPHLNTLHEFYKYTNSRVISSHHQCMRVVQIHTHALPQAPAAGLFSTVLRIFGQLTCLEDNLTLFTHFKKVHNAAKVFTSNKRWSVRFCIFLYRNKKMIEYSYSPWLALRSVRS